MPTCGGFKIPNGGPPPDANSTKSPQNPSVRFRPCGSDGHATPSNVPRAAAVPVHGAMHPLASSPDGYVHVHGPTAAAHFLSRAVQIPGSVNDKLGFLGRFDVRLALACGRHSGILIPLHRSPHQCRERRPCANGRPRRFPYSDFRRLASTWRPLQDIRDHVPSSRRFQVTRRSRQCEYCGPPPNRRFQFLYDIPRYTLTIMRARTWRARAASTSIHREVAPRRTRSCRLQLTRSARWRASPPWKGRAGTSARWSTGGKFERRVTDSVGHYVIQDVPLVRGHSRPRTMGISIGPRRARSQRRRFGRAARVVLPKDRNIAPGPWRLRYAVAESHGYSSRQLSASGSHDPDGTIVLYEWTTRTWHRGFTSATPGRPVAPIPRLRASSP